MCLLIPALKIDCRSLSLRVREQTEGRRLNLKEHCQKKKRDNAGCKNWSMAGTAAKNSEGLDKNNSSIEGMALSHDKVMCYF